MSPSGSRFVPALSPAACRLLLACSIAFGVAAIPYLFLEPTPSMRSLALLGAVLSAPAIILARMADVCEHPATLFAVGGTLYRAFAYPAVRYGTRAWDLARVSAGRAAR